MPLQLMERVKDMNFPDIRMETVYDPVECVMVPIYHIEEKPVRGLEKILAKAKEMYVSPRVAVTSRISFLADRKAELARKIWGCEQQAMRLGCGPNNLSTVEDFRRLVKETALMEKYRAMQLEYRQIETETESLTGYLNGRKTNKDSITEDQKHEAHRRDARLVLEAADIKVSKNGMLKCPFHNDKSESASVAKGVLVCFAGCTPGDESTKQYWDAVALYRRLFECDYFAAVRGVLAL